MIIRIFILTVMTVFLAGCLNHSTKSEPLIISDQTACQKINLKVNQQLIVSLASNPTTGYQWTLKKQPEFLHAVNEGVYQQDKHPEGMVGVGEISTWTFQAKTKGSGSLLLTYERSWEKEQPAKQFECMITVD